MERLQTTLIPTPLGPIRAIGNNRALFFLNFEDGKGNGKKIAQLKQKLPCLIEDGMNPVIELIQEELGHYFQGSLQQFLTSREELGTPFQKKVWQELCAIDFGETRSYADVAIAMQLPLGYRAVANANGANAFAIMVPCHRVIAADGSLGGYGSGLARKSWLLKHERNVYGSQSFSLPKCR